MKSNVSIILSNGLHIWCLIYETFVSLSQKFSPVLSHRKCYSFTFTFWSLIHFELFFIYFERLGWRLLFYIWISNFFSTLFIAKSLLLTLNGLGNYVKKKKDHLCVHLYLNSVFCFIDLYVSLYANTTAMCLLQHLDGLWLCSAIQVMQAFQICSFSKLFGYSNSFTLM